MASTSGERASLVWQVGHGCSLHESCCCDHASGLQVAVFPLLAEIIPNLTGLDFFVSSLEASQSICLPAQVHCTANTRIFSLKVRQPSVVCLCSTLPHFQQNDMGPEARGFVENSYLRGLTPQVRMCMDIYDLPCTHSAHEGAYHMRAVSSYTYMCMSLDHRRLQL